jgi:hypothetical protein
LPRTGILVGVSGGPDSMALLHVLKQLNQAPLKAAHLNHGLRPGDCDADEQLVRAFCQEQGIELVAAAVDVKEQARQTGLAWKRPGGKRGGSFSGNRPVSGLRKIRNSTKCGSPWRTISTTRQKPYFCIWDAAAALMALPVWHRARDPSSGPCWVSVALQSGII